jgi:hypothetical protein
MDIEADGGGPDLSMSIDEQERHAADFTNARRYAARDCEVLIRRLRAEGGDAIVVLPDWEESTGAIAEVGVARWVGLPVIPIADALDRLEKGTFPGTGE